MVATIDCTITTDTDLIMTTDMAARFVRRNEKQTNILVLSAGDESVVVTDDSWAWGYRDAERLALAKGYGLFAWVNRDGTRGAGQMTGMERFEPVAMRRLAIVA